MACTLHCAEPASQAIRLQPKGEQKMKNSFIRALSLGIALAFPMTVLAQEAGGDKPAAEKKEKKATKKEKKADDAAAPAGDAAGKAEKKGKKSKADKAAGEGAAKP